MSEFFTSLRDFLPKRVSLLPSLKVAAGAFLICLLLGFIIHKRLNIGYYDRKNTQDESEVEKAKSITMNIMYSLLVCAVAVFVANGAYDLQFYFDNRAINAEWFVYQKYFPALFR